MKGLSRLRQLKKRRASPCGNVQKPGTAEENAENTGPEETALTSWKRPIVVIKAIHHITADVTLGLGTLGAFLPYMPVHYMIFEKTGLPAVVLTSGNMTDEPVIIGNDEALATLGPVTDAVITYNRDICNRNDDSVVRVVAGIERVHRRSRGYVPSPVRLDFDVDGYLATGAELSNCFCIGKVNRLI
jgi:hydrogenase maturation protein HypF